LWHHFGADPDTDPVRHQTDADPHSTQVLHFLENRKNINFNHSNASFPFPISGKSVVIFSILDSIEILWKKVKKMYVLRIDTDPDPAKRCGSDLIWIHKTSTDIS
jgi:hypothetical protein